MRKEFSLVFLLSAMAGTASAQSADYYCLDGAAPLQRHESSTLRVASLNIAHGRGSAINQMLLGRGRIESNLDRVAARLGESGAQVVALQELDVDSVWSGRFDHVARLLAASGLNCATLGLHAQSWLYRFGTGLLSRVALTEPRVRTFEPTPPTTTKGLVAATLRWRLGDESLAVRLVSVHLDFARKGARERQLAQIIAAIKDSPVPIIVMGDFNEEWLAEDSVVRRLEEEGGMIAYEPRSEELATYKSKRLDWILLSPELKFVSYRVLDDDISDHRLVVAELGWRQEP